MTVLKELSIFRALYGEIVFSPKDLGQQIHFEDVYFSEDLSMRVSKLGIWCRAE